ncbi:MAG: sulfatase-like hydrolase/transferase [Henriciella sp.]
MLKRVAVVLALVVLVGGFVAWLNRGEILLKIIKMSHTDVAPTQAIDWDRGPETAAQSPDERPPNIILIVLDDVGINDLSTLGGGVANGRVPTPNIDALAYDGALFRQAYSGTGTCAPSRAMLMTGRYPTRTGFEFTPTPPNMSYLMSVLSDDAPPEGFPVPEFAQANSEVTPDYNDQGLPGDEITVAEMLKSQGYHTVHIGKWHLGRSAESNPNAQGFDESLLMASGLFLPEDDPNVVNAKLDFDPIDKFLWARMQFAASYNTPDLPTTDEDWFEPGGYLTDYWTDEAVKVIDANANRPFFLYLAHWALHTPLQATREDYEAVGDIMPHRLRVYAAMLRALDRSVGDIVAKLEAEGLADNTLIILTNDNGGAGYVGLPEINEPYRGWKITLFEGGIRVPLYMKWPARIPPGTIIEDPAAHIDVMPTIVAAANVSLPQDRIIDGVNLMPVAEGDGEIEREHDAIFWQSGYVRVVRAGNWKLQVDGRQQKSWLFDLENDPTEQINLADSRLDKLDELQALLDAHAANAREPLYPYLLESPIRIDKTVDQPISLDDEYVWWPN